MASEFMGGGARCSWAACSLVCRQWLGQCGAWQERLRTLICAHMLLFLARWLTRHLLDITT